MVHKMYDKEMNQKIIGPIALALIREVDMAAGKPVCHIHYWSSEPFAAQFYDQYIYHHIIEVIQEQKGKPK